MRNRPDTPDERIQRRRSRRWKRRVRILGPFLGVPVLLATLAFSVDFIEYQPRPEPDHLTDRPIRISPETNSSATSIVQPGPSQSFPARRPVPADTDNALDASGDSIARDSESAPLVLRPPSRPYATR